ETHPSWNTVGFSTRANEGILLKTADWGQGAPYNNLCPTVEGKKAPTGCVATAMAIAMKYHNWPDYTRGDVQTDYYFPELGFDFSKYTIDWKALDNPEDPKFADEVSKLMFSAGVCNSMAYGPEESGAAVWPVGHKMIELYTYAKGNQFVAKERYSGEEWESMLKNQIKNVGPVIYCGDGSGSHCFIVDGYDANGLFHINWGWDGEQNGYYTLGTAEENANFFPENQAMIIDLKPDKERKVYSKAFIPNVAEYQSQEWNFFSPDITPGERQQVLIPTITQNCFSGYYGLAVVDENDNIKQIFHTTPPGDGIRLSCPYPGAAWGNHYQGDKGINFPKLKEGERYQLVSMEATYETNGQENPGFWSWTPNRPSSDPKDWKIVLGGIDYPSYFYEKGNKSEVSEVTFHIDDKLPVFMELHHIYPSSEPFTIRQLKWESVGECLHIPKKGFSIEVKCRDKEGNPKEVIWVNTEDDYQVGNSSTYNFTITMSEDYYDVYLKYNEDKDTRKDSGFSQEEIVEENGLIFKIEEEEVAVIGYDSLPEEITIPEKIKTPKGELPVTTIKGDAFLNAPVKHITFKEGLTLIDDLAFSGIDNLESISFENKNYIMGFHWGYPFLKTQIKNIYFDRFPYEYEIKHLLGIQTWQGNNTSIWDPYEEDSATTDHQNVRIYSLNHSEYDYQFNEFLKWLNTLKSVYKLEDVIESITMPGIGESSAAMAEIKKYDLPIRQMWSYAIDKTNKLVKIDDVIPEVKIKNVMINGVNVEKGSDGFYHYGDTRAEDISVSIAYSLNDSKEVVNEYSPFYNSGMNDTDLTTGLDMIDGGSATTLKDVYNLQGVRILTKASQKDIDNLQPDVYIIREGNRSRKVIIRK
ncbi:MAG: C10 family peptidase, partial [Muribaculaceae bacterium]|nr:C10 family peptidase [Muribaculaceae bacterium]